VANLLNTVFQFDSSSELKICSIISNQDNFYSLLKSLNMKQNILLLFCCFIFYNVCNAQQVFSTAGKSVSNSNLKLDYTIGEPIILTKSNGTTTLTQGFHQPTYQFVTKVSQSLKDIVDIKLFPNPTNEFLQIEISKLNNLKLAFDIIDLNGKYLSSNVKILNEQTQLNIKDFPSGTYYIQIRNENENQTTTYSIIKTN
jgi:hypothetical protein